MGCRGSSVTLPSQPQVGREVAVAEICEEHDDGALAQGAGDAQGRHVRRAARLAYQQRLLAAQAVDHVVCLVGGDAELQVELVLVIDAGHDRGCHVLQALQAVKRVLGLRRDHLQVRVLRLEEPSGSHDGPARADAGHEVGHVALGLAPDLRTGRLVVGERVGLVVVLIGLEVALGIGRQHLAAEPDGAVATLEGVAEDRAGAERRHHLLALAAHVGGHHQLDRIAGGGADHGERDAGVARVESRMVLPGTRRPCRMPSWIILRAGRSFTEPPGLKPSILPKRRTPGAIPSRTRWISTSGVLPISSSTDGDTRGPSPEAVGPADRPAWATSDAIRAQRPPAMSGTIDSSSPAFRGVSRCWRNRMSSPFTKMLTKRRTWPDSSQMRSRMPG